MGSRMQYRERTGSKKLVGTIVIVMAALLLGSCRTNIEETNESVHVVEDNDEIEPNYTAFGLYDIDKNYIDNGSRLELKDAEKHIVEVGQNLSTDVEYVLLAFADYKQISFSVGEAVYQKYYFDLEKKQMKDIIIEHKDLSKYHELTYLIIPEADQKVAGDNMEQALKYAVVYSLRYMLGNELPQTERKYSSAQIAQTDQDGIFLTDSENELKILTTVKSNATLFLHIAENKENIKEYLFFALCDWEQVPIEEGMDYFLFKNKVGEKWIKQFDLTSLPAGSNYQIIGIPNPFRELDFYSNEGVRYTHRINLIN